jgi:hypothetical protein
MTVAEIRAKYWKACSKIEEETDEVGKIRRIQMLQAEMLCEMAVQQAATNEILERTIGVMNFEELTLQMSKLIQVLGGEETA